MIYVIYNKDHIHSCI